MLSLEQTINGAEKVLTNTFEQSVSIMDYEVLSRDKKRNRLVRVILDDTLSHVPGSFVIKQAARKEYDPDDYSAQATVMHFNDWAGTEFLSSLAMDGELPISPRYYGGDRELGYIMEDFGTHKSAIEFQGETIQIDANLLPILFHGSAKQAEQGLVAWMQCVGKLHAMTMGKETVYESFRNGLGNRKHSSRQVRANWFRDLFPGIEDAFKKLDFKAEKRFYQELDHLAKTIECPGPFLAYTHGDACPDNCSYIDGRVRLIDFETGGFQHAMLDAVYPRITFPTCGWCKTLPNAVVEILETAYRSQLVKGCPQASEDVAFYTGIRDACAIWTVSILNNLADSMEEDRAWGVATTRERILTRLEVLAGLDIEPNHLPSVSETIARLFWKLRDFWPDSTILPVYPAFNSGG